MNRARFVFGEADNVVAKVLVKLLAHAVQALCGVACIQARRPERVALLNRHFARQVEGFSLQIAAAVGFGFRTQAVVAAPAQMHAPDVAVHFAERRRTRNQRREVFMGGFTPAVFNHKAVVFKRHAVRLKFPDPAPVEGHHLPCAFGHG